MQRVWVPDYAESTRRLLWHPELSFKPAGVSIPRDPQLSAPC